MIPGITARHAIITPECREAHGVEGAFDEAVRRLRAEYLACQCAENRSVSFHVALTVERPDTCSHCSCKTHYQQQCCYCERKTPTGETPTVCARML